MNAEHELLTITEAADLMRTPVATLRYWRHLSAGPPSFRLGRRVLYRADDLHAWIHAQAAASQVAAKPADSDVTLRTYPPRMAREVRSGKH